MKDQSVHSNSKTIIEKVLELSVAAVCLYLCWTLFLHHIITDMDNHYDLEGVFIEGREVKSRGGTQSIIKFSTDDNVKIFGTYDLKLLTLVNGLKGRRVSLRYYVNYSYPFGVNTILGIHSDGQLVYQLSDYDGYIIEE